VVVGGVRRGDCRGGGGGGEVVEEGVKGGFGGGGKDKGIVDWGSDWDEMAWDGMAH